MRKLLISCLTILLLCAAVNAYAFSSAIQACISAGGGAASCDASTNEVGDRTKYSDNATLQYTAQTLYCQAYTPDCSGNTVTGCVLQRGTNNSQRILVGLYSKTTTAPAAEDAKLAESSLISSGSTDNEFVCANTGSYAVSTATTYWVCVLPTSAGGNWPAYIGNGDSNRYNKAIASDSLPANLSTGFTGPTDDRFGSYYITVGP